MIREEEPPRPSTAAVVERRAAEPGREPPDRAGEAREAGAWRTGLDRDEGAGEGSGPALRDGQRSRARHPALPGRRASRSVPAECGVPAAQVRPQIPQVPGHGRAICAALGGRRAGQHLASDPRHAGRNEGPASPGGRRARAATSGDQLVSRHASRQAAALRRARGMGYRTQVFSLLQQALQLDTPDKDIDRLRDEAVACLGDFVGLEPITWEDFPETSQIQTIALTPEGEHMAVALDNGTVQVRNVRTGGVLAQLSESAVALGVDPANRWLVTAGATGTIKVWPDYGAARLPAAQTIEMRAALAGMARNGRFAVAYSHAEGWWVAFSLGRGTAGSHGAAQRSICGACRNSPGERRWPVGGYGLRPRKQALRPGVERAGPGTEGDLFCGDLPRYPCACRSARMEDFWRASMGMTG